MKIRDVENQDIPVVVAMLNKHLSFGLATEEDTRKRLNDTQTVFKCMEANGKIIAILKATKFKTFDDEKLNALGFFEKANNFFKENGIQKDFMTIDLAVVIPSERGNGYLQALLKECVPEKTPLVSVLWLRKDEPINLSRYSKTLEIERYWDGLDYPCPDCEGFCECDVVAVIK